MTKISYQTNFKSEIELVESTITSWSNTLPRDGVWGLQSNSFYYRNAKIWNNLPKGVVDAKTISKFKQKLDEAWKDNPTKFNHIERFKICIAWQWAAYQWGGVPMGGVPTGGVPTGGVPTGGVPTGGVPTGGVPTGGVPTGGVPTGVPIKKGRKQLHW